MPISSPTSDSTLPPAQHSGAQLEAGEEKRISISFTKIKAHLWVEAEPIDAAVKILNHEAEFSQGMELEQGNYEIEVSADGYEPKRKWVELGTGKDCHISVGLSPVIKPPAPEPSPIDMPPLAEPVVIESPLTSPVEEAVSGPTESLQAKPLEEPQPIVTASILPRAFPLARLLTLVGLLVVLGVAGGIWWHWHQPVDAKGYFKRGYSYFEKEQYDLAIRDLSEAIKLNSQYIDAYFLRGIAHGHKGEYNLAIADLSKAIDLDPKSAPSYSARGYSYFKKRQYDLAIRDFSKAIRLDPKNRNVYSRRGFAYAYKGQYSLAISDLSKVIKLDPNEGDAYTDRGAIFLLIGKYDKAENDFKKALELNPNLTTAIVKMAELYSMSGKTQDSCKWLRKAIEKGYDEWDYIKKSETFNNIRSSSCYKNIMNER